MASEQLGCHDRLFAFQEKGGNRRGKRNQKTLYRHRNANCQGNGSAGAADPSGLSGQTHWPVPHHSRNGQPADQGPSTWFRYSQNTGGDAITLVQQFCDKTFPEAVEYLLTFNGRARDSPAKAVTPVKQIDPPKPFALPPRNTDDRRVFAYLRKRGIAAQVIRQFMNSGLLYEDAEHHNCVFVGKNSAGQAKYAGLRGTYDRDGKGFRGDVTGSDKNTGFPIPHDPTSNQVRVFEAPIDLMSYLSLHRELINAVALCGLYDGALETYLKDNPSIKRITLCLDADAPGRAAAQQLKDKYSARGYAV